jgi:transcriptional regulator GlxA family with amidase domain
LDSVFQQVPSLNQSLQAHQNRESNEIQHQPIAEHKKKLDFQIQEVLRLMENNINEFFLMFSNRLMLNFIALTHLMNNKLLTDSFSNIWNFYH